VATIDATGDILVFYRLSGRDWHVVDASHEAGRTVIGYLTSWQTRDGPFNVEHLASVDDNGQLLIFYWSPKLR
jgi:hypothetical protein